MWRNKREFWRFCMSLLQAYCVVLGVLIVLDYEKRLTRAVQASIRCILYVPSHFCVRVYCHKLWGCPTPPPTSTTSVSPSASRMSSSSQPTFFSTWLLASGWASQAWMSSYHLQMLEIYHFCLSVIMQGEQEHFEWILLGWSGHGLVAGECV